VDGELTERGASGQAGLAGRANLGEQAVWAGSAGGEGHGRMAGCVSWRSWFSNGPAVLVFVTVVSSLSGCGPSTAGVQDHAGASAPVERGKNGPGAPGSIDVTVDEGTSMSVAVSPDGQTLAIDLQGAIWVVPASGGAAKRITDEFSDARQPAWSPDGRTIAFFAYRDGGYDIWAVGPDGGGLHKLTWGPYDDREPAWSHDGSHLAFSSDRGEPLGSNYNIWILDLATGALHRVTSNPAEDFMPSWSPDDREIAFASTREGSHGVWAVRVANGVERKLATSTGTVDAASWSSGDALVYHALVGMMSRLESAGQALTTDENVFPFRPSWVSATEFFYTSDGKIRRRRLGSGAAEMVAFTATLGVTPARYTRRPRDVDSTAPRKALGLVRPVLSPDGTRVAFAALGDIYVMEVGSAPQNLTGDRFLDTDPAWSPDGRRLVYASDKGGDLLQLWIRDLGTGADRQLTRLTTQPMAPTWSPDGSRIVFQEVDGMWRRAAVSVVDVTTGRVTRIHDSLFGPGTPTWSADGKRVALAMVSPYSTRYREGTNQVLTMSAEGGDDRWYAPVPNLSIDSRGGCGPVWSPDGTKMAAIYEGALHVWPVSTSGEPLGPVRRLTTEIAHSPSWAADSRRLLYQSNDRLAIVDVLTGETRDVPVDLTYAPQLPTGRILVHAGRLVDGVSESVRTDMDIEIEGHRIRSVEPHADSRHTGTVIDGTPWTAMPGLIEFHSHLQKDFGEAQGRAWLAFGVTTVRSPGNTPYEAVEDREAREAGVRPGPRVFGTGYLMEWQRVYYKMGIAISSPAQFEMELERAKVLQHDLIKSYVRLPDVQQRRMVEFAHEIGVPVATHEIYPAALVGVDNTEHTSATSRRGYSPKQSTLQRAYADVIQLFGKSGRYLCPMISGGGLRRIFAADPGLANDPRFALYPQWMRNEIPPAPLATPGGGADSPGNRQMVMDVMKAGGKIVAGTDTPNAINLHGELATYVQAGMTPYQALRAATVTPAEALALDAGSIQPGKLADIVLVDGNPLEDIAAAYRVKHVIANGRSFTMDELLHPSARSGQPTGN
jgi:Tol biopolymer transport system component/imidazolonepropionase-like amidohydrolase